MALPPSMTRFNRTSGVWPMLSELSSYTRTLDLPVVDVLILFLLPRPEQVGEGGLVDHPADGPLHLLPHRRERRRLAFAAVPALALLRALDVAQHLAHGGGFGGPGEQIAAFGAAARFHESTLFEAGQNQFQKLLRDLLALRDIGDPNRFTGPPGRQVEDGLQRVFTFDGIVHWGWRANHLYLTRDCIHGGELAQQTLRLA